jgi:hypothetical protein
LPNHEENKHLDSHGIKSLERDKEFLFIPQSSKTPLKGGEPH